MNYLAHFHLSYNDPDWLCGNFIADRVKGKAFTKYSSRVQTGILLHREIDSFTDSHPIVHKSKQRLFPKYRHYSAVIVDMFYDHFLALNWNRYSSTPLKDFVDQCYRSLLTREDLPVQSAFILRYMHEQDWLSNYANKNGLTNALTGLSNRTVFESQMEKSVDDLFKDYKLFEQEFFDFFPLLAINCELWLTENGHETHSFK